MKSKNWVWLTRDAGGEYYNLHLRKRLQPASDAEGVYYGDGDCFCRELFEKVTDFRLKPGEMTKVEITVRRKE